MAMRPVSGGGSRAAGRVMKAAFLAGFFCVSLQAARLEPFRLHHFSITVGGPPVTLLPADLNSDGRLDLLVATAFTSWGQRATESTKEVGGRMVEEMEVIPTLTDRRELQLWLALPDGSYAAAAPAQPLPPSVLAFAAGPSREPVLALTDAGVAGVRYTGPREDPALRFEPLIRERPVMAGMGSLLPCYDFTADVDGDGELDLLFPAVDGLAIHLGADGRVDGEAATRIHLPGDTTGKDGVVWRFFPLPSIEDVDGDEWPDLVILHQTSGRALVNVEGQSGPQAISVLRGLGQGRFRAPEEIVLSGPTRLPQPTAADGQLNPGGESMAPGSGPSGGGDPANQPLLPGSLAFFGDLDGDGRAELVTWAQQDRPGEGMRQALKNAKRPRMTHRFYRVDENLHVAPQPYQELSTQGHPFASFTFRDRSSSGFLDLDGDGRRDLVTLDLEFSLWQIPKVLLTRSIGVGLSFHVWLQETGGSFHQVRENRLEGKLKIDLSRAKLDQMAQFSGDFDGDGRLDFVHLGGRRIGIHRGQAGARYPVQPDAIVILDAKPEDPGLIQIRDLDGDRRSDLVVITLLEPDDVGVTRPTRLDFYMTAGAP